MIDEDEKADRMEEKGVVDQQGVLKERKGRGDELESCWVWDCRKS